MGAAHILTYAKHLEGGGVERAMLRLAGGWLAAGRQVTLVVGQLSGPLVAEVPAGLEIVALAAASEGAVSPLGKSVWPLRVVPAIVGERRPDIVFCPGNFYTSVAALTRLRLGHGAPVTVGKMSNAADRSDLGAVGAIANRAWLATHGRFLDHLVAMTPDTAAVAAHALHMVGRTSVIPNPPVQPILGAAPLALPGGRFILGVGRLVAQKRWDRLIAALPALADAQVSLVIVGEGERRAALEAQVAGLGLGHRVFLPGHGADPLPAMARAALVALPSDFEGVPGVLREALSVGTPVVATDSSPAVAEIVTSPALGSVVAADDGAALVAALDHWLRPGAVRPAPVPQPGHDAAGRYLTLFDRLVEERAASPAPARFLPAAPTAVPARP
jgi:glycosyltransferase involved in cell wall biosynthesis